MVASQSHWSRLDESNSAENPELSEGGFMLCLRFVRHKQDVAALLRLCHQILSFRPQMLRGHRLCCPAAALSGIMLPFPFPISGDIRLPHVWSREIINSQESAISKIMF